MNSKKHWPRMFLKSNSSNQLPETSNLSAMRPPYSEGALSRNYLREEETNMPKTKPRWHPKPEQIQILEAIFNSGVVNPSREEIKRIRGQLEEFGQVGDVSVFYWFQNRKSRVKRKRHVQDAQKSKPDKTTSSTASTSTTSTSTSMLSKPITVGNQPPSSSTVPVSSLPGNQNYEMRVNQEMRNPQCSNMQALGGAGTTARSGILNEEVQENSITNANRSIIVFINDIPMEVPKEPLNFRAFFGDDALLLHSYGELVLVNEWGFTLEGLEHGAKYFLI